jgi:N4-gp56 family major capsid protein
MADTSAATGLTVQQWDDKFFKEYFQENRFKSEMGTSENSIIHVKEFGAEKGKTMTWALVNRLTGTGVTGSSTLEGNEEDMDSRSFTIDIVKRRHAVRVSDQEEQYSAIGLRNAAKMVLKDWAVENTRDRIITAMHQINGVDYASATEAQKDAWLDDNTDRVLFGAVQSNLSTSSPAGGATYDHSASLAAVDSSADVFSTSIASVMKRMALTATPRVRPIRSTSTGRRYYVAYCHPYVFRDLKSDTTLQQAQRDVGLRMQNEKLFQGGDVEWDGIIFKEIDDMPVLTGVGNGTIDVSPVFFCGAQAVAYGIKKRWYSTEEKFDYGDKHGCAINEFGNFGKMTFGTGEGDTTDLKDNGIVTGYMSCVADA